MIYLRNAVQYSTFYDRATKVQIVRDAVVKVEVLSDKIKKRIRHKGLIECTEEEYAAYLEKAGKIESAPPVAEGEKVEEEPKPADAPEEGASAEEPKEPEKTDAVDSPSGVITSSPRPAPRPRLRRK